MATYLIVGKDGTIINRVLWDGDPKNWSTSDVYKLVPYEGPASIGWRWDGTEAIDPNPRSAFKREPKLIPPATDGGPTDVA